MLLEDFQGIINYLADVLSEDRFTLSDAAEDLEEEPPFVAEIAPQPEDEVA